MAVVGTAHIRQGFPKADFSLTGRKYTVEWLVTVDDRNDGPLIVQAASGLPAAYSNYSIGNEHDDYALIREWNAERLDDKDPFHWIVRAVYSTPPEKQSSGGGGGGTTGTGQGTATDTAGAFTNPLLELPTVKTTTTEREVPITRIYSFNTQTYVAPMNSACEVFNPPPMRKERSLQITISRNEQLSNLHPYLGVRYSGAVNKDSFWGFWAGLVQCQSVNAERQTKQLPSGGTFVYLKVDYVFLVKWDNWNLAVLDAGNYYCSSPNASGSRNQIWAGQSGSGSGSGNPGLGYATPLNCPQCTTKISFLTTQGHERKGLLDGQGGKLPDNQDPVYLIIQPYEWLYFAPLGLPQALSQCQ